MSSNQVIGNKTGKTNSTYIPFARKYRPSNFSELMGQEVLVKTLTYCIANNRLAQAHLLTGIRGVGKTSSARIIAKTVNCTDPNKTNDQILPCEKCKNCESFNKHNHPDIIEIDAASRTGVDDIREIIESSEYRPLLAAYKFFIIDEIHMLSKSAFNALLKVVEEPPEHVIFIFATTEVQKIPLTVISRCQRYDLRRLNFDELLALLSDISKKENIQVDIEALKIIAVKSEGSARDAVSMLDQASSYMHNIDDQDIITADIISSMLGLLQTSTVIKFTKLIVANNPSDAIKLLEEIYSKANSLEYFVQTMSDFMAELSKAKAIPNYHNPIYQNHFTEITDILIGMSLSRITVLWQIFSNGVHDIKQSHNELVTSQMLIIKAIYACNLPSAEEIMEVDNFDNKLSTPITANSTAINSDSTPETIDSSKSNEGVKLEKTRIFDFLKYCHKNKEMESYYFLLNEVGIENFSNNEIKIAGKISSNSKSTISKLLKDWSGEDWSISLSDEKNTPPLKEYMLDKVKQAEDFQIIKNHFPEATISDILLKS